MAGLSSLPTKNQTFGHLEISHRRSAAAEQLLSFLTSKHDPASVGTVYPLFRTVTVMSAPEIKTFIDSGDYTLRLSRNNKQPESPDYIEILPKDASIVARLGVQPHSALPTTACDRFGAVSGEVAFPKTLFG